MNSPEKRLSEPLDDQPLSAEDSPASLTALQESIKRLVTAVTSGQNCGESFAKLNPDGSWVKTSRGSVQANLDGSSEEYCETWPKWGIVRDGVAGKLPMLERRTTENAYSLLPTILGASENPAAHGQSNGGFKQKINRLLAMCPTPTARDHKDTGENTNYQKLAKKSKLSGTIAMLPTVTATTANCTSLGINFEKRKEKGHLDGIIGCSRGLMLQPAFVEWMMGFPLNWTDLTDIPMLLYQDVKEQTVCVVSEMPSCRSKSTRSSKQSQNLKRQG